jgi:hypothetical protein
MSTIVSQTLSNGTVSTSTANCIQGSARAWVNFTGSSGVISSSYNVSSITINGTGQYTVNFTNALPNGNYAFAGSSVRSGSTPILTVGPNGTTTTTALPIKTQEYDASLGTAGRTSIIVLSS